MKEIQIELNLLEYPNKGRLPYRQEGFTLSVQDSTLHFQTEVEKDLSVWCGDKGITRIELIQPFLFVWWDRREDPYADMDEAVALIAGASIEYLEPIA